MNWNFTEGTMKKLTAWNKQKEYMDLHQMITSRIQEQAEADRKEMIRSLLQPANGWQTWVDPKQEKFLQRMEQPSEVSAHIEAGNYEMKLSDVYYYEQDEEYEFIFTWRFKDIDYSSEERVHADKELETFYDKGTYLDPDSDRTKSFKQFDEMAKKQAKRERLRVLTGDVQVEVY